MQVSRLIVGRSRSTFPTLKSSIDLKNGILQQTVTYEIKINVYDVTDMITPTTANQQFEKYGRTCDNWRRPKYIGYNRFIRCVLTYI